jgi:hypothetical protein
LPHLDFGWPLLRLTSPSGAIFCFGAALAVIVIRFVFSPIASGPSEGTLLGQV